VPPEQPKSHTLPLLQVQAAPEQLPLHWSLLPTQVSAQLPPLQVKAQLLLIPQVQAAPWQLPLQLGLLLLQLMAQLPPMHENAQLAWSSQVQAPPLHSASQIDPTRHSAGQLPDVQLRSQVQPTGQAQY
jgi:hypothetical protein